MMTKVEAWCVFSEQVKKHIEQTEHGHYIGINTIDVMDFIDSQYGIDSVYAWIKDTIKYVVRRPRTGNQLDLLKAAHMVCRIWVTFERSQEDEEMEIAVLSPESGGHYA